MQAVDQDEIISTSLAEYERSTTRRAWHEQFKVVQLFPNTFLVYLRHQLRDKHSLWSLKTETVRNHAANRKKRFKEQV